MSEGWRGQGGGSTKWLFLADAGGSDDDESRKYPRKVRRGTSKKEADRRTSTSKFTHTLRPTARVLSHYLLLRTTGLVPLPSSRVTTTNLGTKHTTTNAALLLMDSSLMKYLDESARIYCALARPALSRIVHDKPALISPRRSTGLP